MLKDDPNYRRLKLRTTGILSSASYWMGKDHLLIVVLDGYRENYRRIYFRDIQSILLRRTNGWLFFGAGCLLMALLLGALPLSAGDAVGYWMGGINLAIWLPALAVDLAMGPTCRCRLTTAVQSRDLPAIGRWRQAERLLEQLVPEIQRAQQSFAGAPEAAARESAPVEAAAGSPPPEPSV